MKMIQPVTITFLDLYKCLLVIKKAQRIGQKCQNNKTFEKILSYVARSKGEEPEKEQSKESNRDNKHILLI